MPTGRKTENRMETTTEPIETDKASTAAAVRERLLENALIARDVCFERDEVFMASIAAYLAREHVWLYGPPGTGKSELVRYFASQFTGARYGEFLFSKQTTEADVIAYRDVPAYLKGEDKWNLTPLTGAEIAFGDELFKASSATLNGALAWLNERKVKGTLTSPLQTLFAASNEVPRGEELCALRDRILVAFDVRPIKSSENRKRMLKRGKPRELHPISEADVQLAREAIDKLEMSDAALDALVVLFEQLNAGGVPVTDRRLVKSIAFVKAAAWLMGQDTDVQPVELQCLRHVLWLQPDQQPAVEAAISMIDRGAAGQMQDLTDRVAEMRRAAIEANELFLRAPAIIQAARDGAAKLKELVEQFPGLRPRAKRYALELKTLARESERVLQEKMEKKS